MLMLGRKYTIYKVECRSNGRAYIGRTENFQRRKQSHLTALRSNRHPNEEMQNDFLKYGEKKFVISTLCQVIRGFRGDVNSDGKVEKFWMDYFKSYDRQFGYNYKDPKYRGLWK